MNPLSIFPSGLELANLLVNSNLLTHSLAAISTFEAANNSFHALKWGVYPQSDFVILGFVTSPLSTIHRLQQAGDLVSSTTLKQDNFNLFDFLCTKTTSSFCINRAAITLFAQHLGDLTHIKNQLVDLSGKLLVEKPLIITGNSLGGSVASLFTLWLLDSINQPSKMKRPLCITFGSPLIGDLGLQKSIAECSSWNSCFLNVAANLDPVPSLLIPRLPQPLAPPPEAIVYRPFGAFLFCSELGCTFVEDPEEVAFLLEAMGLHSRLSQIAEEQLLAYYGNIVENLKTRLVFKGSSVFGFRVDDPLHSAIVLQLEAIGDTRIQQPQLDTGIIDLIKKLRESEKRSSLNKKKALDPSRKLNEIKIRMAYLEWYKKTCKAKRIGYYDSHKNHLCNNHLSTSDIEITKHKKFLSKYWTEMVEEAEKKPYKEGAFIGLTWLFAGTNYRRMVEPLDIAEHYAKGKRHYESTGRSKHYILLEKWQKETAEKPRNGPSNKKKRDVGGNLTEDSCFWAKVEEAIVSCEGLKDATCDAREKQSSMEYLIGFERYVMEEIRNYAVSPEIFLEGSSFMKWWNGFKDIASNSSFAIAEFMFNRRFLQYESGSY